MNSKRRHEGYLLVDHRFSPGIAPELAAAVGMPANAGTGLFEAPTYTCSHCQRVVVLNPNRLRPREYCAKCNHYICDGCAKLKAVTGECRTFKQIIEETQEAASRAT
jgi:hypothetical protein